MDSPEPGGSNGSQSNRSVQPSPTTAAPMRVVDEDYDEGVTDTLISLSQYRAPEVTTGPGYPVQCPVCQVDLSQIQALPHSRRLSSYFSLLFPICLHPLCAPHTATM